MSEKWYCRLFFKVRMYRWGCCSCCIYWHRYSYDIYVYTSLSCMTSTGTIAGHSTKQRRIKPSPVLQPYCSISWWLYCSYIFIVLPVNYTGSQAVLNAIQTCVTYNDKSAVTHTPPLQSVAFPDYAWNKFDIDIVSLFTEATVDCQFTITVMDYYCMLI